MRFEKKIQVKLFILFLFSCAAILRIYNLNWGAPFYFNPDERNIASSVTEIVFPRQLNPHFFAYGSFPIYCIFVLGQILQLFSSPTVSFANAILASRIFSAVLSILLIPLLYLIGKKIENKRIGLITAFLSATSVGFIQFAHFGTFEMWLTFFSVLLFYFSLQFLQNSDSVSLFLLSITFGILIATKVTSFVFFPILVLAIFLAFFLYHKLHKKKLLTSLFQTSRGIFLFTITSTFVFFITNPFTILDHASFLNSMKYESSVALGTMKVFYTGEFYNTLPIIFQFTRVYPFLMNPVIVVLFFLSFLVLIPSLFKSKNIPYLFVYLFYLVVFLPQAFLFVKWVRYMVPTLPFMYLIIALGAEHSLQYGRKQLKHYINYFPIGALILSYVCGLFAIAYFITAFVEKDTRIQASIWAKKFIPSDAPILSEVYDLGITAFNANFPNITLFNFYELDNNSLDYNNITLRETLAGNNYIILPSQRILKTRILDPSEFPNGNAFYTALLNGKEKYKKIYETPCSIWCKIIYLTNPVYSFEETANVFDRPTVYIFAK